MTDLGLVEELHDLLWLLVVVPQYLVAELALYCKLKPVLPKWVHHPIEGLGWVVGLWGWSRVGGILAFGEEGSLGATAFLIAGKVFPDPKDLKAVLVLTLHLCAETPELFPRPFKDMPGVSHLPRFHSEMDVELLVGSGDQHILRPNLREHLLAEPR